MLAGVEARVLECPRCGAALPRRAALVRVTCEYCKSEVVFERLLVKASEYRRLLEGYRNAEAADVELAGFRLRVLGRLAVGHSADVFLARRATRLGERLLLKVLRSPADEPRLRHEQAVLEALADSPVRGTRHFTSLLPRPAFSGQLQGAGYPATFAAAFRQPAGFAHTWAQLREQFPHGVDARHAVWLWRRGLELLDWVHRSGWVHGAVLPAHLLLDAREHSVGLVGWSCAGRAGDALGAMDPRHAELYPFEQADAARLSFEADRIMLARALLFATGGSASAAPSTWPSPLAQLLSAHASGAAGGDALSTTKQLSAVAEQCFGPPKFLKLELT
jgi:hypothetical protein